MKTLSNARSFGAPPPNDTFGWRGKHIVVESTGKVDLMNVALGSGPGGALACRARAERSSGYEMDIGFDTEPLWEAADKLAGAVAMTPVHFDYGIDYGNRPIDDEPLELTYQELVSAWQVETITSSSVSEMVSHWAYLRIIGLGAAAIPLILSSMEDGVRHLGIALKAVTGVDPAAGAQTQQEVTDAWLAWDRSSSVA